jgi:rubrerythrin
MEQPTEMSEKKRRLKATERLEMRREMLNLSIEGYPMSSVYDALVKKYGSIGLTAEAAERDWQRRETWMPLMLRLDKPDDTLRDLLLEMKNAREKSWEIYRQALKEKNHNAAVGAMKHISESIRDEIELLQSLGKMTKTPTAITGEIMVKNVMWKPDDAPKT